MAKKAAKKAAAKKAAKKAPSTAEKIAAAEKDLLKLKEQQKKEAEAAGETTEKPAKKGEADGAFFRED